MFLRVGYIPEHFSTPIAFAKKYGFFTKRGLDVQLLPYPSGSGHLISSLKEGEIDVAVGLTEAFVRGLCNEPAKNYNIVGEYVKSPLCWAVSTGKDRQLSGLADLKIHNKIGVSRIGSGSYVMSYVLALQHGFSKNAFDFKVLHNFQNLRDSVNKGETDAFMWEYFTSKKYYDSGEIKKIGEIYTPWPSWVVASAPKVDASGFLEAVKEGIEHFNTNKEEAVEYILDNLDYDSREDVEEWYKRVEFSGGKVDFATLQNVEKILRTAGIVTEEEGVVIERLREGTQ